MPSLLPNFEYDIFISYRHKDNRAEKWVSQFVQALRKELEGAFKESISIYFDENPYDELLENHSVDQSLNNKLKSLILIPVVSQTYTDPKSYTWQHEFCAFNKIALEDTIGRDIRLGNGNVGSRILPITIHELNTEDIDQIETELQAKFRSINFTYRAPGVNRALRPGDRREDNMGRLAFRDQMNKVANALKVIINGVRFPDKPGYSGIPTSDEDSAYLKSDSTPKPKSKAQQANDIDLSWLHIDPLLSGLTEQTNHRANKETDFSGVENFILNKLKVEMPFNLSYHNLDHIHNVLNAALEIANSENIGKEEIKLIRIAALYHDAGFISTYKGHEAAGCQLAKETLPNFGFSADQVDAICRMIIATKIPQSPQNHLDRILCDADLDYLGREDFYEISSRLFNEMKEHGFIETEREWNLTQKVFLENHLYHTDFSKTHREGKKQEHLTQVISKLQR